ncbi:MAG: spore coat protein [Oscillospiraceae bacterium]|jgi:spore coat protein CotF|nr:spore coat protein [Oscillospiraceae bacterium]
MNNQFTQSQTAQGQFPQINQNQMNQANQASQASQAWDDRCMMSDLLDTSKHIASQYGSYIIEGSTQPLRQVLTGNLDETFNDQFQIFETMQQRGWYQTKPAQQPDIQTAKQKFTQTKQTLQ